VACEPRPRCACCGTAGVPAFRGLADRIFGAPGRWDLSACPDRACGLLWLDPMPAAAEIGKLYESYYTHADEPILESPARSAYRRLADAYLHRRYGYFPDRAGAGERLRGLLLYLHPGRRSLADGSVASLPLRKGGRVLEVGCGSGATLRRLQDLGWEVEGVDFDPRAVENARAKGLRVRQGELAGQGFEPDAFDAVIASHVIEHVPDPAGLARQCLRLLRPGGVLVVQTPNASSLGRAVFGEHWRGLEPPRHLHIFTPRALVALLERAGFAEVGWEPMESAGVLFLHSWMLRKHGGLLPPDGSLRTRLVTELAFFAEWLVCRMRPAAGQVILARARRR
jgi:2-polyprenyl-3-methyl-5-hydroxy-6-metoxy-1,4-benzoquinol methylase